jgi:hypothetical protein
MIEQVVAGFGFFEAILESNQANGKIFQKVVSSIPFVRTFWADFKRIHFHLLLAIFDSRYTRFDTDYNPKAYSLRP